MARLVTGHTADLEPGVLAAAHQLVAAAFGDLMNEHDWDHALGGVHALVWEGDELVGHASVIQRRLLHEGRALRAGYVEGVAVDAAHRRRGHAGAMMEALERVIRGGYDLGALCAADAAARIYAARGWEVWRGPTSALTPSGVVRTPEEDGAVHVLRGTVPLDLAGEITCDWRDGDVW
jgi:aminoglycoside 2'-N-acetyltransferase I